MQSMTGFGRAEKAIGPFQYVVEVKSVNHRYLDVRSRLPPQLQPYETVLAEAVRSVLARGSVEISVRQKLTASEKTAEGTTQFVVDEKALKSFKKACKQIDQQVSLEAILATGKIILPVEETPEASTLAPQVRKVIDEAVKVLVAARQREGAETAKALSATVKSLQSLAKQWSQSAADHPTKIRERLTKKIQQWSLPGQIDAQRLEMEVAFFADRADIAEEIQRFGSHLEEFSRLLSSATPVGRKLDFLTQELHREVNTIASKSDDLGVSRLCVDAKTAIEKLREQVQNVE